MRGLLAPLCSSVALAKCAPEWCAPAELPPNGVLRRGASVRSSGGHRFVGLSISSISSTSRCRVEKVISVVHNEFRRRRCPQNLKAHLFKKWTIIFFLGMSPSRSASIREVAGPPESLTFGCRVFEIPLSDRGFRFVQFHAHPRVPPVAVTCTSASPLIHFPLVLNSGPRARVWHRIEYRALSVPSCVFSWSALP